MPLNNDDIQQLIAILQRGLTTDSQQDNSATIEPKKIRKNKTKTKSEEPVRINKFDQMREKNLHKEDSEIDKILSKYPPTVRSREFSPIEVCCRLCGKREEINPSLLHDAPNRYKCNRCSKEPG